MDAASGGSEVKSVAAKSDAALLHRGRRLPFDVAVDSGVGKSIINPSDVPECALLPSQGQSRGQRFICASGERLPSIAAKCIPLMMTDGAIRMDPFQAAPIRKPLLAVSATFEIGHMCFFDSDGSYIIERDCPEGTQIQ